MEALRTALAEASLPAESDPGHGVAARLRAFLEQNRAGSRIIDLDVHGPWVHLTAAEGEPRHWEIECYSPNDFRAYPGYERDGTIVWANIWVRGSNLTVDELVEQLNDVAFRKEENA
jgi:hypothetical protein